MSTEYTPEDCAKLKTVDDKKYKCIVNEKGNGCKEVEKSECEVNNVYTGGLRRRISTDDDIKMFCASLETSSDEYDCIPNEDGVECEEMLIDHSNNLKTSYYNSLLITLYMKFNYVLIIY